MTCSLSTDARMVVWPVSIELAANVDCLGSISVRAGLQNPGAYDVMWLAVRPEPLNGSGLCHMTDAGPSGWSCGPAYDHNRASSIRTTMGRKISRRQFLSTSATTAASLNLATAPELRSSGMHPDSPNPSTGNWVRWLDGRAPPLPAGVTWGTP